MHACIAVAIFPLTFLQALLTWLLDIAKHLTSIEATSSDNGRKMCSVLIILNVLFKTYRCFHRRDINAYDVSRLFSMLHLMPESYQSYRATKHSLDLNFLMRYIPEDNYGEVAAALIFFVNLIVPVAVRPEWVYVIPLIHIFDKTTQPFGNPQLTSGSISWTDKKIRLASINTNSLNEISRYNYIYHSYTCKLNCTCMLA